MVKGWMWQALALVVGFGLPGCGEEAGSPDAVVDVGRPVDGQTPDVEPVDMAAGDSGPPDADARDMAPADMAPPDADARDMASPDMAAVDMASPDMASPDMASPDMASAPDPAVEPDAGPPPLALDFSEPPVDVPEGTRFAAAVQYGDDPRMLLDALLPPAGEPTAAVIFIHGGGFVGGTRTQAWQGAAANARAAIAEGVAYISVDYRLLDAVGVEDEGVLKSMRDARRALQFVRLHADAFGVDPARIALTGGSAGAGTSLWLAFSPDMADPDSADPVERQSTRVVAVAVTSPQATYDLLRWAPDVFSPTYPIDSHTLIFETPGLAARMVQFYGLPGDLADDPDALEETLETPALLDYRATADMLDLYTADDPPALAVSRQPDAAPGEADFDLLHHPLHARAVIERGRAVGAPEPVLVAPALGEDGGGQTPIRFLLERLQ